MIKTKPIRVLINGLHAKSGGGITYLRSVVPYLAEDPRLELHLFLHAEQCELFLPVDERVRLHVLDFHPGFWRLLLWEQVSLPIIARVMAADVTFSPANFGPLLAPRTVILLRNALAVAGTERRPMKRLYWAGLGAMTLVSLLGAARAIAVSEYAKRALSFGLRGRIGRKVSVVHHGVDERFSPGPSGEHGARYLLAVGDIYIQKNLLTLIRAFSRVREAHPDMRLRIAGRPIDSGYYAQVLDLVAREELAESVEFLNEQSMDRLVSLYRGCAAFVFPSTAETFGNPLAEAMACSTAIACSNAAAMPEIVGDTAELFDPSDAGDVAQKICAILDDPERAERLRAASRARATRFSWALTAQKTADVLVAAAGRGAAAPETAGYGAHPEESGSR